MRSLLLYILRLCFEQTRFVLLLLAAFVFVCGFVETADDVFFDADEPQDTVHVLDRSVLPWLSQFRSPLLNQAMTDLTALGSVSVVVLLSVLLGSLLIVQRDRTGLLHLTLILVGAAVLPVLLKSIFIRDRPDIAEHLVHVSDFSFPSGHSFGAAAIYIGLAYLASRHVHSVRQEIFFYVLAGLVIAIVGFSRLFLGVHYPTDVVAGICGGGAWACLVSAIFTRLGWFRSNRS